MIHFLLSQNRGGGRGLNRESEIHWLLAQCHSTAAFLSKSTTGPNYLSSLSWLFLHPTNKNITYHHFYFFVLFYFFCKKYYLDTIKLFKGDKRRALILY